MCDDLAIEASGAPSAGLGLADYIASDGKGSFFGARPKDAKTDVSPFGEPDCCKPHCATRE
ncbi:hypothetical protein [Pelagimonas varians]|uniref:hypothetical protein n=1 Tax=Pelagimonas varians TaxID=696760 RepID=UPI001473186D|nr:hypothetical protein [Pelagimonas varians]